MKESQPSPNLASLIVGQPDTMWFQKTTEGNILSLYYSVQLDKSRMWDILQDNWSGFFKKIQGHEKQQRKKAEGLL